MNIRLIFIVYLSLYLFSCSNQSTPATILAKDEVKSIVLIGGSLISSMEDHPFLEVALTKHFYGSAFSLKNIAWAADDVYGMARSQFGSAQNTKTWSPPNAEDGFGSQVMRKQITEAAPTTLIIGYGGEAAFFEKEADFELFESGYERLLDFADTLNAKLILLTVPKHRKGFSEEDKLVARNESLTKINAYITAEAKKRDLLLIDLSQKMEEQSGNEDLTTNGIQFNKEGYARMSEVILEALGIKMTNGFSLKIDDNGEIIKSENCNTSLWDSTVNGVRFKLKPNIGLLNGVVTSPQPVSVYVNGILESRSGNINEVRLGLDNDREDRLVKTIQEKNRLYRNRLRPLNEAYIYLFRQHEMGHLAYEMDDLLKLVAEKEKEIQGLIYSYTYDFEIELEKPYKAPKKYADDEIPAFIPEPNIPSELAAFNVADGYEISLFASDPMIANPINVNWDAQGRAWVATSSTYPHIVPGREPNDKIIILEDTNGDGTADKHTVFAENLLVPHSVMPVKGGAYVTTTTQLLFLSDRDQDGISDDRTVVFDGFGNADVHHTIHGLRWTPWGDLHFTQGIYINSFIETINGSRTLNGSGVWSFRPEKMELEIYSRGLVNPWGEAIDKWGQTFATDGAGSSGINYIYPESAHRTAVGASSILNGLNDETPKYTAAEILYSSHFPKNMQGDVITNDFRANRTVRYKLKPKASSYESTEEQTLLFSEHRSYRPVDAKIGPDGALYIVDWYNPIIDHGEVDFHHPKRDKSHGRIWKLKKKNTPLLPFTNMQSLKNSQLLDLLKSEEQLSRLLANRTLVERNIDLKEVMKWLISQNTNAPEFSHYRLEVLWLYAALDHYDNQLLNQALDSRNYKERAAAVRLIAHYNKQEELFDKLKSLIKDDHPQVRLEILHALRQLPTLESIELAVMEDNLEKDENISFVLSLLLAKSAQIWLEELESGRNLFDNKLEKQMLALLNSNDDRVTPHLAKILEDKSVNEDLLFRGWEHLARIGGGDSKNKVLRKALSDYEVNLLKIVNSAPEKDNEIPDDLSLLGDLINHDSLEMKLEAIDLAGRWKAIEYLDNLEELADSSTNVKLLLKINRAFADMGELERVKEVAMNGDNPMQRVMASAIWVEKDVNNATSNAVDLMKEMEDAELGEVLFESYRRTDNGPKLLTAALMNETISESMASAGLKIVQTSGLNLAELELALRKAGSISSIGMELTDEEKDALVEEAIANGSEGRGRMVYRRNELMCGSCHVINKEGGLSGPYLGKIGTFMTPRAILESVINPNAVIKQNYETVVITKKDGEVISGILQRKTGNSTLLRQANGQVVEISDGEIDKTDVSSYSLMPSGLTRNLHKDELKDLLSYLMSLGVED